MGFIKLKKFKISERVSVDLRDARNSWNNPLFDNPTAVITSTIFGRINEQRHQTTPAESNFAVSGISTTYRSREQARQ